VKQGVNESSAQDHELGQLGLHCIVPVFVVCGCLLEVCLQLASERVSTIDASGTS
jgi:hypothetical protein